VPRRTERYEIFANQDEISEKLAKYDKQYKPYYRYYFLLFTIMFTFQILYAFYFTKKNDVFVKTTIIFYIVLILIFYVPYRLNNPNISFEMLARLCELITDLYPILLLIVYCIISKSDENEILKLTFLI